MAAALAPGGLLDWAAADERFHHLLTDRCGNRRLAAPSTVQDQSHRARLLTLHLRPPPTPRPGGAPPDHRRHPRRRDRKRRRRRGRCTGPRARRPDAAARAVWHAQICESWPPTALAIGIGLARVAYGAGDDARRGVRAWLTSRASWPGSRHAWPRRRSAAGSRATFPSSPRSTRPVRHRRRHRRRPCGDGRRRRRAVLDPERLQGVHAHPGAGQGRRRAVAPGRPRAFRQRLQLDRPARARARHPAQPVHQCRGDRRRRRHPGRRQAERGAGRDRQLPAAGRPTTTRSRSTPRWRASEAETGFRNAALANFLRAFGNLHHPPEHTLGVYFHHCAIAMSCRQLALAGRFLANAGRDRGRPAGRSSPPSACAGSTR